MTLLADGGGRGVELVEYPLPPSGMGDRYSQTISSLNVQQRSCAVVNFPYINESAAMLCMLIILFFIRQNA